ncbi:hypothetical protein ABW20_dc0106231 [Dactylellina cionopaga]|nr:hypothetical protein ABW20_dc0106231 [Dactylellina cionopaga]
MVDSSIISLLFSYDGLGPPQWLKLALAGGSRSRPCCRYCGSYDHSPRDCRVLEIIKPQSQVGLRVGNPDDDEWKTVGGKKKKNSRGGGNTGQGGNNSGGSGRGNNNESGGYHGRGGVRGGAWNQVGPGEANRGGSHQAGNSQRRGYQGGRGNPRGRGGRGGGNNNSVDNLTETFQGQSFGRGGGPDARSSDPIEAAAQVAASIENTALAERLHIHGGRDWRFPLRRAYSNSLAAGKPKVVIANYFELALNDVKITRYELEVSPKSLNKRVIDNFIEKTFATKIASIAPDYAGYIYAPKDWAPGAKTYTEKYDGTSYDFIVKNPMELDIERFKRYFSGGRIFSDNDFLLDNQTVENSVIPTGCNNVIQALNAIVLRYPRISNKNLIHAKRNTIYDSDPTRNVGLSRSPADLPGVDVGEGAQLLTGFHASVRPGSQRCLLNVSKATNLYYRPISLSSGIRLSGGRGATFPNQSLKGKRKTGELADILESIN